MYHCQFFITITLVLSEACTDSYVFFGILIKLCPSTCHQLCGTFSSAPRSSSTPKPRGRPSPSNAPLALWEAGSSSAKNRVNNSTFSANHPSAQLRLAHSASASQEVKQEEWFLSPSGSWPGPTPGSTGVAGMEGGEILTSTLKSSLSMVSFEWNAVRASFHS